MSSSGSTPESRDYFKDIELPDTEAMRLDLEGLVQQGILTPEQAQAAYLETSAMEGVSQDQATVQAQMDALSYLQDINASGGMTAKDRSLLNQIQQQEATQSRGAREAILSDAQARGMAGSGLSLMSQMKNQQDAATRQSTRDLDVAGMAQERALQAMMNQGTLAGQMGSQQFAQDAAKAGAKDAIAQFNAQNKQQVNLVNTAANNEAAARNLAVKQGISDANIGQANKQQQYNKGLGQQHYENQLRKAGGQSNVSMSNANAAGANSAAEAQADNQNIATALTVASMFASDERLKENIEDFNASDFLDSLSPKTYNYKNSKHGKPTASVMAQDLEKTQVGSSMVQNTPEGKMIDVTKATGPILASLADINKRLKKQEGK